MSTPLDGPAALLEALGSPESLLPWQGRLLEAWRRGESYDALDLPTGLGKTSVIAIWLVARACAAGDGGHAAHLGRRLVYVVDRRAVVDQATRVANELRDWVGRRPDVAGALGLTDQPLPISTLRGKLADNREWLAMPSTPAIVVGTVDMIGSRVLFEGYGCSRKMRPYHAGMLGCDTLVVLDEAHLVPPFERLLEQMSRTDHLWPKGDECADWMPRLRLLSLSATGRTADRHLLQLDEADHAHTVVRQRLHATKRVTWHTPVARSKLAEALAERAWARAKASEAPTRIVVFANARDDAERALAATQKLARADAKQGVAELPELELLVGARRLHEREAAEERLRSLGFLAGSTRPERHALLFATSAGEVGIDIDCDHMVCDAAPWERMVQRLGRTNRRGLGAARVDVVADAEAEITPAVAALIERLPEPAPGERDASPHALGGLRDREPAAVRAASTPEPLYPPLTRPVVEAWAMTSLVDHTGRPEVAPWLRGWLDDDPPQTTLVWRRHLPSARSGVQDVLAFFEAAPPHLTEQLTTETYRVVDWLLARAAKIEKREKPAERLELPDGVPLAVTLDGAGRPGKTYSLDDFARPRTKRSRDQLTRDLAGRQLVVHAEIGGLSEPGLLDPGAEIPAPSGDVEHPLWAKAPVDDVPPLPFRVRHVRVDAAEPLVEPGARWRERLRLPVISSSEDEITHCLVVDKWADDSANEEDRSSGPDQKLAEHHAWTGDEAEKIASALALPGPIQRALVVAAELHDEGKRAERWQRAFHARPDGPYAKTRGPIAFGVLDGYRHELGSLPIAAKDPRVAELPSDMQELVLHLIAAHHGFARPSIGTRGCDDAPPSVVEGRAREVALRFLRLQGRYGPWGLAWLETLLRAADQRASRRNDAQESKR